MQYCPTFATDALQRKPSPTLQWLIYEKRQSRLMMALMIMMMSIILIYYKAGRAQQRSKPGVRVDAAGKASTKEKDVIDFSRPAYQCKLRRLATHCLHYILNNHAKVPLLAILDTLQAVPSIRWSSFPCVSWSCLILTKNIPACSSLLGGWQGISTTE